MGGSCHQGKWTVNIFTRHVISSLDLFQHSLPKRSPDEPAGMTRKKRKRFNTTLFIFRCFYPSKKKKKIRKIILTGYPQWAIYRNSLKETGFTIKLNIYEWTPCAKVLRQSFYWINKINLQHPGSDSSFLWTSAVQPYIIRPSYHFLAAFWDRFKRFGK